MKSQEIIEKVTARIIEQLEAGVKPWQCAWDRSGGQFGIPMNPKTKEDYKGINIPILWNTADLGGFKTNIWLGYGQAKELGGQVKNGAKGTHGVIYKPLVVDDEKAKDGKRTIPMLKQFVVFNLEQIDGLEHLIPPPPEEGQIFDPIPIAEQILQKSGARLRENGPRAFYRRSDDSITLPDRFRFKTAEDFYATGLHELTHWTGHESRLDRKYGNRFGDKAYAFEELVAEMGAAFLSAKLGLKGELQHASYIASWIEVLKKDNQALIKAASQAQKAFEYLHALVDWQTVEAEAKAEHTQVETVIIAEPVQLPKAEELPDVHPTVDKPEPEASKEVRVISSVVENPVGSRKISKRRIPPTTQGAFDF